jgi:activator of 2-hydroxyglutaryl-CoA dehydratase
MAQENKSSGDGQKPAGSANIDWKKGKIITAGFDVGSVSTQAVVTVDGELLAYGNTRTGSDSPNSAWTGMNFALEKTDLKVDNIDYTVGTGYGRVNVPMAQQAITEISCHARGANFMYGPEDSDRHGYGRPRL